LLSGARVAEQGDIRRDGFNDGLRAMAPLLLAIVPFGLVLGVTAAGSVLGGGLGIATSQIIFAGAAQLVTVQLFDDGAAAVIVVVTALVVNIRHLMYSAALASHFQDFPRRSRMLLPYLLTDQNFALSILQYEKNVDPVYKRWFFLGVGVGLWVPWQIATIAGVMLGAQIPESLGLGFAIPLVFLVLLIPVIQTRPGLASALVGGLVAVIANGAPYHLGLVIGAMAGVATGVVLERMGEP
jgi:4-azaleucine resistance transporter AzlC